MSLLPFLPRKVGKNGCLVFVAGLGDKGEQGLSGLGVPDPHFAVVGAGQ